MHPTSVYVSCVFVPGRTSMIHDNDPHVHSSSGRPFGPVPSGLMVRCGAVRCGAGKPSLEVSECSLASRSFIK